jgi:hypothetical protein
VAAATSQSIRRAARATPRRALLVGGEVVGAALVATTSAIHLYLWATGYNEIPTIGPLFLTQGIAGAVIAVALVAWRRIGTVAVGVAFMLASIGGLLMSVLVGLFGFKETLGAPYAGLALAVESSGAAVLALVAAELIGRAART